MNKGSTDTGFSGDKKHGASFLTKQERKFINWAVPKIPEPIMTQHLTFMTLIWSILIVVFGYLGTINIQWIHGISIMVFLQWLTDSLDGSLGKYRKQGLVKWGFFMDHFLDLIFAGSIVIAYSLFTPSSMNILLMLLLLSTCASMAVSFLGFAATNKFQISHYGIGPTEIRIGYILLNTFVAFVTVDIFWWGVPVILAANGIALVILVSITSDELWRTDKEANVDNR